MCDKNPGMLPNLPYPSITLPMSLSKLETLLTAFKDHPVVVVYNVHLQPSWFGIKSVIDECACIFIWVGQGKWRPWMQHAEKIVLEDPYDLKSIITDFYDKEETPTINKLLFALSYFHTVVNNRWKFGAIGWNQHIYSF